MTAQADTATGTVPDLLDFTCPRCAAAASERFYGPCATCRDALAASLGGDVRQVEAAAYEPKMNVTPNAVALKD
jgi:hypothetical protein